MGPAKGYQHNYRTFQLLSSINFQKKIAKPQTDIFFSTMKTFSTETLISNHKQLS